MATIEQEVMPEQDATPQQAWVLPRQYVWTRRKYEEAVARGVFGPEDRVELLEGVIVERMPQNSSRSTALTLAQDALRALFPAGHLVRGQMPLILGELSEPEPDIAVVRGAVRDYKNTHPTGREAVLVVEISNTTLSTDRNAKAAIYARALIPEYWIVNLTERILEVYRQPEPAGDQLLGFAYQQVLRMPETETIVPVSGSNVSISVADLLP